ncbi:TPR-like protein [Ascobolus immersus RN42]|uniref:TPR-like protein n=1 Tax=Ascobolus immersus RN42 TaxID=1160509 RepID=A0A3N4I506_ASCIM|nr:TPR-like protein [Ascobolus immersus RN42]
MEQFLREWRQDAFNKHHYDTAIFFGDKLMAITGDPRDAFWLAQVHFSTGHYSRAHSYLMQQGLVSKSSACQYLAALCLIKQSRYDDAMQILGDHTPPHLLASPSTSQIDYGKNTRRKARVKIESDFGSLGTGTEHDEDGEATHIKFEAAMCYLRGTIYCKQNNFDRAKDCFKDACRIDVKCFEAFDELMTNNLLSPDEEWAFLESLDFESLDTAANDGGKTAEMVKLLYTTRLSKYKHPDRFEGAVNALIKKQPGLSENPDILQSQAELAFTQCKFKSCHAQCERIVALDPHNFSIYPLYLACLHELNERNKLFLVAHDMADNHPDEPVSWLAVGVYYLTIGKISEARRFFSKASLMDPHFGAAWIGFAHTFAAEGEHDQAIAAYSTAARLFQGTHLPQLFLGMQHLQLQNTQLADEYLHTALGICDSDPLLLNELGVVLYNKESLSQAIKMFKQALEIAKEIDSDPKAWVATRANLGHAYRRIGELDKALQCFAEVTAAAVKDANIYCAIGLISLQAGRPWDAILALHEALAISPQDPIAQELLEKALKESAGKSDSLGLFRPVIMGTDVSDILIQSEDEIERFVENRTRPPGPKAKARAPGSTRTRRSRRTLGIEDDSLMEVSEKEG